MDKDSIGEIRRESEFASAGKHTTLAQLQQAQKNATILCGIPEQIDRDGSLWFSFHEMKGFLPAQRADISLHLWALPPSALEDRLGRPTCFIVSGFAEENGETRAVLDRYAVQEQYLREVLAKHEAGDVLPCIVRTVTPATALCDMGLGILAGLRLRDICMSPIHNVWDMIDCGSELHAVLNDCDADGRILISTRELLGTWAENITWVHEGLITTGIVRGAEEGRCYIELTPNLYAYSSRLPGKYHYGDEVAVRVSRVNEQTGIIRVTVLSHFLEPLRFYNVGRHLDKWSYHEGRHVQIGHFSDFQWMQRKRGQSVADSQASKNS